MGRPNGTRERLSPTPGVSPCFQTVQEQMRSQALPARSPADSVTRMSGWVALCLLALALAPFPVAAATQPPPDARQHWAFHPPGAIAPPAVQGTRWVRTDIDRFILAKLEANRLVPAPPADARRLIRRMSFDLTGLPPTMEEVEHFAKAAARNRVEAIARLIDQFLASPRYGERWGRHWLDVARYSDTKGYVYAREEPRFVHAPAYRDWVIRAFNDDLPYDRFLLLQMAADQLVPAASPDLTAMGFLTGGRRFLGVTHDIIDDRIDVVTRGTMALTVACARCHDHKYDPIPTRDYYSFYGVFHGADDRLVPLAASEDKDLSDKRRKFGDKLSQRREEANARMRSRVGDYLAAQLELKNYPEEGFDQFLSADDLIPFSVRRWRDFLHQTRAEPHSIFAPWHALVALKDVPDADFEKAASVVLAPVLARTNLNRLVRLEFSKPISSLREAANRYGAVFSAVNDQWKTTIADAEKRKASQPERLDDPAAEELRRFLHDLDAPTVVPDTGIVNTEYYFPTTVCEELWKLQGDVDRRLIALGAPAALVLTDRAPEPNPPVFNRGRASHLGEEVPRQFLEVISSPKRKPFQQGSGRLELARAIANADNPLTARVMVNPICQHHFGSGLVKTPSDFGLRAELPSHPELLDWLARRFVAEGWSVKTMHRLIMSSAVYQQSSLISSTASLKSAASRDPDNRLLSRFPAHRLEFEQLRDAMLSASAELDLSMGGKPADLLDAGNKRRTVYALVDRQFLPGTFRTFDFANPDIHVAVRHETTVPQQALFFLNGPFAANCAKALAKRFADKPPRERVQQLHRALYQRLATKGEVAAALRFISAAETDQLPAPSPVRETQWRYGYGEYDETTRRLKSFTALSHFTGTAWQAAPSYPGGEPRWAQLTAAGGHPRHTLAQACIRRWVW